MEHALLYPVKERSKIDFISSICTIKNDGILIYNNDKIEFIKFEDIKNVLLSKETVSLSFNLILVMIISFFSLYVIIALNYIELPINTFLILIAFIFYLVINAEGTSLVIKRKNDISLKIRLKREQVDDSKEFIRQIIGILREKKVGFKL